VGVCAQAVCVLGEPLRAITGDPVIAAQAAVDDLLAVGHDEPVN
jgi:hypothetical protein